MRCIFCKQISLNSSSVQHIIPESLGNNNLILPKGIVCDTCNQYFAVKVEKLLLEMKYFQNLRFRNYIKSKKGRNIPFKTLFPYKDGGWFDMYINDDSIGFSGDDNKIINLLKKGKVHSMIFEIVDMPKKDNYHMSRFLAKTAIEAFAIKEPNNRDWINEIIEMKELDPLRNYARYGKGDQWVYNQRRIYSEETRFVDPIYHPKPYEVLHEMDFLVLDSGIYYFILVIMGVEFVINCGGSELDLYYEWQNDNEGRSPIRRYSERMVEKP